MLVELISAAGLQALLVAIALVVPRQRSRSERLLGALLLIVAAELAVAQLVFTGRLTDWPHLVRLTTPLGFLYAPLCYVLCRSLLDRDQGWRRHAFWHLLPALVVVIYFLPLYAAPASEKLAYLSRLQQQPLPLESLIVGGAKRLQMLVYLGLSIRLLISAGRTRARLAAVLVVGTLAALWLGDMFDYLFDFGFGTLMDRLQMVGLGVSVLLLTLAALLRSRMMPMAGRRRLTNASPPIDDALFDALTRLFKTEKVFLDARLTLPGLAERLGSTSHEVSRLLNQRCGENFASYVNRHRVAEARRLLDETDTRITDVAFAAGFNSLSTFNAAFRRLTGFAPSAYRRNGKRSGIAS